MSETQNTEMGATNSSYKPAADPNVTTEGLRPTVFVATVLVVFVADQLSKAWIVKSMPLFSSRPIVGEAFKLTLTHNTGGAWGFLPTGNGVFAIFAALAIMALLIAYQKVGRIDIRIGAAFALAMGGAIGNLVDRVRLHYVVDFFDARIIHWPIFNIADSAITVSIILLIWHFLRAPKSQTASQVSSPASASLPVE